MRWEEEVEQGGGGEGGGGRRRRRRREDKEGGGGGRTHTQHNWWVGCKRHRRQYFPRLIGVMAFQVRRRRFFLTSGCCTWTGSGARRRFFEGVVTPVAVCWSSSVYFRYALLPSSRRGDTKS